MSEDKDKCKCGNEKTKISKRCRECFCKGKASSLTKNRFERKFLKIKIENE